MNQIDKNTVSAKNQTQQKVFFPHSDNGGVKILFVGNSITFHDICEDTGWFHRWGMAASAEKNDYVHQVIEMLCKDKIKSDVCVCQASGWECQYKNAPDIAQIDSEYKQARDFAADIIVMRVIENCSSKSFEKAPFVKTYNEMVSYFGKNENAKIIVTSSFWKHPGDETLQTLSTEKYGGNFVYLGDLGELDEMKAIGKYEDEGIQNHPGDKGMKAIAERIYKEIQKLL